MKARLSIIEKMNKAPSREGLLKIFRKALLDLGADCFAVNFVPRANQRIEDVNLAWHVPSEWQALYSSANFFQRDPAVRHSLHTVLPFDWASAPYNLEAEPGMKEVGERAQDFGMHKGIQIPVPGVRGIAGMVWIAGPYFDERSVHEPLLHALALHAFHRLEQLIGRRLPEDAGLTDREREVLAWASEGKTAWEIGCILKLSQRTVEWHFREAYKKLGATNRMQAIALFGGPPTSG